jgi:hypothetical protein
VFCTGATGCQVQQLLLGAWRYNSNGELHLQVDCIRPAVDTPPACWAPSVPLLSTLTTVWNHAPSSCCERPLMTHTSLAGSDVNAWSTCNTCRGEGGGRHTAKHTRMSQQKTTHVTCWSMMPMLHQQLALASRASFKDARKQP